MVVVAKAPAHAAPVPRARLGPKDYFPHVGLAAISGDCGCSATTPHQKIICQQPFTAALQHRHIGEGMVRVESVTSPP
jgi:hypothetical protein